MGRQKTQQGSSLPEVLVATALLVTLLAPLVTLFGASSMTSLDSGRKSGAVNVGRTWMERFLAMDWPAMDQFLRDPLNGFVELEPGQKWERAFAPDPSRPQFEVRVIVQSRRLRDPFLDDAMPDQLTVRDITITVRWRQQDAYFTVQQATTMHKR